MRAVVLSMVQCHGESNAAEAKQVLWAIANLAAGNAGNKTKLGEGGACTGACSITFVGVCASFVSESCCKRVLLCMCVCLFGACLCACACVFDAVCLVV